jgi:hypothetical protein
MDRSGSAFTGSSSPDWSSRQEGVALNSFCIPSCEDRLTMMSALSFIIARVRDLTSAQFWTLLILISRARGAVLRSGGLVEDDGHLRGLGLPAD